ncbi:MAG: hypothetical protein H7A39_00185 [Chlamydiales bacterium]|nr:hypothetical protein [Chlamydiales bacterium]
MEPVRGGSPRTTGQGQFTEHQNAVARVTELSANKMQSFLLIKKMKSSFQNQKCAYF